MAKILILNSVAKKTPEEKLFNKKLKLEKLIKQESNNYIDLLSTPDLINETVMGKYEKWKQATILIKKNQKQIEKLEKNLNCKTV